jgi:polyhydroxybutyrate depolymerase
MARLTTAVCILAFSLLLACAGVANTNRQAVGERPPPQTTSGELTSGGEARRFQLHLPSGYAGESPLPLVVNLHGYTANGRAQEALSGMSAKADRERFIVVYPEGRGERQGWFVGPGSQGDVDIRFIRDLVTQLQSQFRIDASRVYATGMSNGGGLTNRLGCEMADVFAAIAPVSGAYFFYEECRPARSMPVVAFHGTADQIVSYAGQGRALPPVADWAAAWARRDGCAADASVTLSQGPVTGQTWNACRDGAEVVLYTIEGGGHTWPGRGLPGANRPSNDIDATDIIWAFFTAHPMGT